VLNLYSGVDYLILMSADKNL